MTATIIPFPSADAADTVGREGVGLVAIISAMRLEAARIGTSTRHLSGGCHISYRVEDDKRDVVAWRDQATVPSESELRTLHRDFSIPHWVMWTWDRRSGIKRAVASWSTGETEPTGQVYEDRRTIAAVHAMVEAGEFTQARATYGRIHGRMEQLAVLDLIITAEDTARNAAT